VPAGLRQVIIELDDQLLVRQIVLPILTVAEVSVVTKLWPMMVMVAPVEVGAFGRVTCVIIGESKVKAAIVVPTRALIVSICVALIP
jgi:hypothetical protein